MSTDQLSQRRGPHSRGDMKLVQYDEYIDTQVESTRRLVKVVDLATSLVVLAASVLAFLLAAAVVEHWLVPGGFPLAVRTALFVLLAGAVVYFAYRRLWPLAVHTINPVYAAQAIEVAAATGPSLKNSLINLLLFRQRRSEISDAVYQTLEEQAAQRLSRVPVDAAVDRSLLIRFGYVLLAVAASAALYKVFSPKDPLITAQRVLMPWAQIVPASRVKISGVEPGSVTVSRGEFLDVSAEVRGIGENDAVLLRFTTQDGQAVNKPVPMKLAKDRLRFESRLPANADSTATVGLSQNLRYRIEAGDARSLDYAVQVVPAPSILVERIEYDYPPYTLYVNRDVERLGDIRAIEGTRITIHGRANGTIRDAHVDFDADGRRDLKMAADGRDARASFVLALREDRLTPKHASYVLRFTNGAGQGNREPVKYAIQVEPDLGPEASILQPEEKERQVRLDETLAIEVEARDPDFALLEVRLRGEVAGRAVIDQPLLQREHGGRFTGRFAFTPSAQDLRAGDTVQYWVTASDNRAPDPNMTASERKILHIVSPDPAQQPPPDRLAQREPQQRPQEDQRRDQQQQESGQQENADRQDGESGDQSSGAGGAGQPRDNQQPQNAPGDGKGGGEQPVSRDAERSAEQGRADKETGSQGEGEADADREAGERQGTASDQQDERSRNQKARSGERNSTDKQTGAGAAGGEPPQNGSQPDGARPDGNSGERSLDGRQQTGDESSDRTSEPAPVSSEGDNDADAFDRIRRHLQRDGELPEGQADSAKEPGESVSRDAQPSAESGQGDKESGRQGDDRTGQEDARTSPKDDNAARDQTGQAGERAEERGEGTGAETKGDDVQEPGEQSGEQQEQTESPGGQETSSEGPSGAGHEQQPQGAPDSQPEMKPGEKRQQAPSPNKQTDDTESPAGGRGKKESDSQGEQGGDRAGGGDEGGGQDAPREGTGSSGQNQSADEGAGESAEQGGGTDSRNAGQDKKADDRTGETGGETPGRGSKQRDGEGQEPGGEKGVSEAERSAEQGQEDKQAGRPGAEETGGEDAPARSTRDAKDSANQSGTPTGAGGETGTTAGPPPRIEGTVPEGDEANLEYARKQTDLVVEKLADQLKRQRVDERLLDELGWSEEDLRRFVERWQSRKEAAQRDDQAGETARRDLDEALRSLGLRRGPLRQGPLKEDTLRDLREGYRGAVPPEYQEQLRAYNQGISRGRRDGE
ncbi:MAG: hypothetical protein WD738_18010 [Pirellulales bacterium]